VAYEKCLEEPPFLEVEKGHFVACWKEFEKNA
jgi:peptide/nickel transport system ATP-binding protein